MRIVETVRSQYRLRPVWMNGIFLFCIYMTFIYVPWDVFSKSLADDREVWFGILFTGWAAKVGGLLHWLVYGAGAYGYYRMKRWMHPWAIVYLLQVALAMFVWSALDEGGAGLLVGVVSSAFFIGLAVLNWRARALFSN